MEAGKVLETLEEGSVELKLGESQSRHDKALEQVSVLTTLSVNCTGSELGTDGPQKAKRSDFGVDNESFKVRNLGKESDFEYWDDGFASIGAEVVMESHGGGVVAVEKETDGASLVCGTQEVGSGVSDGNVMDGGRVSVMEMGYDANESEQVGAEGIVTEDALRKNDLAARVDGGDSQSGKEVSREGISLIVEVFGPLNGICQVDNAYYEGKHMLEEGASECTLSSTRNNHKERVANPTKGDITDNREHKFCVGDLVWVKTKTQLWWPGMISDPTAASKDAAKYDQRDCFLVKYFGNIISVWCSASRIKPFTEYFEHMSQQNKSRSFLGAVEKALLEIGQRIKQEMSCSCSLKERETITATQVHPMSKDNRGELGFFSASVFEPAKFLESIRYRAVDISRPGSIEFAVMKNCLSAFYSSVGHKQLPMHKLRPRNDANDGDDAKDGALHSLALERNGEDLDKLFGDSNLPLGCNTSEQETIISAENVDKSSKGKHEKSFELRERKKSKYLSYPYVNSWDNKDLTSKGVTETENLKGDSHAGMAVKNTLEQSVAFTPLGNCGGRSRRKKSRKSRTFKSIYGKMESIDTSSTEMLQELQLTALDCLYPNESKDSISVMNFFYSFRKHSFLNHDFTSEDNSQQQQQQSHGLNLLKNSSDILIQMEGKMNKENHQEIDVADFKGSEGDKLELAPSSFVSKGRARKRKEIINQNCSENGSLLTDKQDTVERGKVCRKRKKLETKVPGHPEIRVIGGLPDLNSNTMSLSVENMEVTGPDTSKGKLEPKRAKNKEVFVSEASPDTKNSELLNVNRNGTKFIPVLKDARVMGPYPVENNVQFTGLSVAVKPERKKRKRKEKASDFQNSTSAIPDLNGNATDLNSTGKGLTDLSAVTSQGKPQRKRRTKSDVGGVTGSTLLLNFTPGHPLPSKESLNATFIRFGPVVELGTQFISDSSAQVVFAESCDAEGAYQSLEKSSPFGPALASYHLNCPSDANNSTGKGLADLSAVTSQGKPRRKRRRRTTSIVVGRATGNTLILNFAPGYPLPSKKSLNETFIRFGSVVEPETQFLSDSSAQVVFAQSCDAEGAYQSLEKSSPFGPALASYHLHCPPAANNCKMPNTFLPMNALNVPVLPSGITPPNGEAPDLMYIKQNLEMMTAMLEKAGDNISPEMKAKLESEVKGFLKKVSSMVGSSSS